MKRLFVAAVACVIALGVLALGTGVLQAESCDGNGRPGQGNNWCRNCPPPDPGCTLVECTKCGCDYSCPIEPQEPSATRIVRIRV